MLKKILLFSVINFIGAIYLINQFNEKNELIAESKNEGQVVDFKQEEIINDNHSNNDISTKINTCNIFGPLSKENELYIKNLFKKKNDYEIFNKKIYEIYWLLGNNEVEAKKLYNKSIEINLLDENKHKLIKEESGNYIVVINRVDKNKEETENLVEILQEQAKKINLNGIWNYKNSHDLPYVKINNLEELKDKQKELLINKLNDLRQYC